MAATAPAFADPVGESQATFRAVMNAMARPGTIQPLRADIAPPAPLPRGVAALALALADFETPIWLDAKLAGETAVLDWLRFHTGAPQVGDPVQAAFALIADATAAPPFDAFALGTMEYPDRSTTLIVGVEKLGAGESLALAGPGIAEAISLSATPQPANLAERLIANRALFPRGVDLLFVTDDNVAALPRSVRVLTED